MAKANIVGLDDLLKGLEDLLDIEDVEKEVLSESGKILENQMKSEIRKAANRGYATGDLASSISSTAPAKNNNGYFVAVRPVGKDRKGIRNGEKLQYLEHGTSKQQPRPILQKVVSQSENECAEKAQEIISKYENISKDTK